jgi:hypothetical protein
MAKIGKELTGIDIHLQAKGQSKPVWTANAELGGSAVEELMCSLMGNAEHGTDVSERHSGFGGFQRKRDRSLTRLFCSRRSICAGQ